MRKESWFLGKIPNLSLVQRERWRKEPDVAESYITFLRFLYSCNAGEDCTLTRA
jgi:hypothetical protein